MVVTIHFNKPLLSSYSTRGTDFENEGECHIFYNENFQRLLFEKKQGIYMRGRLFTR